MSDESDPTRRVAVAGLAALLAGCGSPGGRVDGVAIGFVSTDASPADRLLLPPGYIATALAAGDGLAGGAGLQYLALDGSRRGLLLTTNEAGDAVNTSIDGAKRAQAEQGVRVTEIELKGTAWQPVGDSKLARRIGATTPLVLTGPAAGHALMKTSADPGGRRVRGSLGPTSVALTPWGTALAGENSFAGAFVSADQPTAHERRYGLRSGGSRWRDFDERFDSVRHPNEPNRFGWVVEFDPLDPGSAPVKRTALGRSAFVGAAATLSRSGRGVVYAADGAGLIYKFVSRDASQPATRGATLAQANATLLDEGRLFVARLEGYGQGRWLALDAAGSFMADAGERLIKARQASDALGATKLARIRGLALGSGVLQLSVGEGSGAGLLRLRERGDVDAEGFEWHRDVVGDFGPLALDPRGLLWLGGGTALLAVGAAGGEPRRLFGGLAHGPVGGIATTPDGRTLFVAVRAPQAALLAVRREGGGVVGA